MNPLYSFRAKLVGTMVLVLTTAIVLLIANDIRLTRKLLTVASDTRLAELGPLLSATLAPAVFERDLATLYEELSDITAIESVVSIEIRDHQDRILSAKGANSRAYPNQAISLETPISLGGEHIGSASLVLSADFLESASRAVAGEGLLIGAAATAASILILLVLSSVVTQRLARLEATALAVTSGSLDVRADTDGRDEVARVAQAFNTILDRLHAATAALEQERFKLHMALEYANANFWEMRPDGHSSAVRHERILGFDSLPTDRNTWHERVHLDDRPRVRSVMDRILSGQCQSSEVEYRIRAESGDYRWLLARGRRLGPESDRNAPIVGLNIDVTSRKQAELALRRSQKQFETLVESLPHGVYLKDRAHRYTLVNRAFADFVGLSKTDLIGQDASTVFPLNEANTANLADLQVKNTGEPIRLEHVATPHGGEPRHLDMTKFPVFGNDGSIVGVGGVNIDVTARHRFEKKLADSEKRFQVLMDNLPYSLAMKDCSGRFTLVNPAFCKAFCEANTPDEVVGKTAADMMPPSAIPRSRAADRYVMSKQRPLRYKSMVPKNHDEGCPRVMDITKFPVFDHLGDLIGLASVAVDVTKERQAEKARQDSEHRFQVIADSLPHPLFLKDATARYLFVNAAGQRLFKDDSEDYVGKTASDMLEPSAAARTSVLDRDVLQTRRPARQIIAYVDGDQTEFHDVIKFPIFDTLGELIGLAGIAVDVTEQRRADEARQQSEQRLRALIENLPFAISMNDLDGRYVVASPLLAKNLGRPVNDILGRRIEELLPDSVARAYKTIEGEVRATHRPATREVVSKCPSGENRVLEVTKFPVFDAHHALVGMAGFNLDITERRNADNRIAQAHRMEMIGQLAGGVAHDFNNLLAVIRGNLEIIGEQTPDDNPGLTRRLQAGLRAVRRGAGLTERLLAVGRRQSLRADAVRPNHILGEIIDVLRSALGGAKIRVTLHSPPGLWPVWVDAGRLEDALLNIALNAGAALPNGGRLDIRASNLEIEATQPGSDLKPGRYVILSLEDNGAGIPAEIRSRIMEPFFSTKRNGSGLGLSVAYGFMRQSGGSLTIESEEGRGTTVQLILPCDPPEKMIDRPPQTPGKSRSARNLAIVVDDQQDMLALTVKRLHELGFETKEASDASAALAILTQHEDAAVLVTDVVFGSRMEGIRLARAARKRIASLPILLVSGQPIRRDLGMSDDSTAFLKKPFSKQDLAATLQSLFDQPSSVTSAQKV